MAAGLVLEFPSSVSEKEYDAVNSQLGLNMRTGEGEWPAGLQSHQGGPSDGGWVVTEVWETKAAQAAFMEARLGPAFQAVGLPAPSRIVWFDIVGNQHRH